MPLATYDNDDILEFARVWTGFVAAAPRGNIESMHQGVMNGANDIDPMRIVGASRDAFPKMDLYDGYLGDGYPLCRDAPPRRFLRKGAAYSYLGHTSLPRQQSGRNGSGFLALSTASALYRTLCANLGC